MVDLLLPQHKPLLLPHHSTGDWDKDTALWGLSTLQFVSSPSSVYFFSTAPPEWTTFLCRNANVNKMPEGRLTCWIRLGHISDYLQFWFRVNSPLGIVSFDNSYILEILTDGDWTLYEFLGGVLQRSWPRFCRGLGVATWYNIRFMWWLSWGLMIFKLEFFRDGAWEQQGDIISVDNPLHGDADLQRTAFRAKCHSDHEYTFFDDYTLDEVLSQT